MSEIPFLKTKKTPRIALEPREEKLINGSAEDVLEDHLIGELMDAAMAKDHSRFRSALESLILNLFEEESEDATNEG